MKTHKPFLLVLCASGALAAQTQDRSPVRAVPASSCCVIEFAGLAACRAAFAEHGLAGLLGDAFERIEPDQRKLVLGPWHDRVAPTARGLLARIDVSPATLRELLGGGVALAVGRPTVASGLLLPSVAVVFAVDEAQPSAERAVARLCTLPGVRGVEDAQIGGAAVKAVHLGNPVVDDLLVAHHAGVLLVTNSRGFLAECLAALAGAPSIAGLPGYRSARSRMPGRSLGSLFVNTATLAAAARPFLPYEADAIGRALGVGELRGLFFGLGSDGRSGTEVCHLALTGDMAGLFRAPFQQSVALGAARYCGEDTVAFAALQVDAKALVQRVRGIARELPDWMKREARIEALRELGGVLEVLERAETWTGELAIGCTMPKLLPIPEVTVFLGVRDAEPVSRALQQLMACSGGEVSSQDFEGCAIHAVQIEVGGVALAPCFTHRDGMLLLSSHPRILKTALRRAISGKQGLLETPAMQRTVEQVQGACAFAFVDTGAIASFSLASPQVMGLLRHRLAQLGLDPGFLPESGEVVAALDPLLVTARIDGEGMTLTSRSPVGTASALTVIGYLVDRALRDLVQRDV